MIQSALLAAVMALLAQCSQAQNLILQESLPAGEYEAVTQADLDEMAEACDNRVSLAYQQGLAEGLEQCPSEECPDPGVDLAYPVFITPAGWKTSYAVNQLTRGQFAVVVEVSEHFGTGTEILFSTGTLVTKGEATGPDTWTTDHFQYQRYNGRWNVLEGVNETIYPDFAALRAYVDAQPDPPPPPCFGVRPCDDP